MGMLGIGLGGFASGFEQGIGLGDKMYKMHRQAEADKGIDDALKQGTADHDAAVAAGTAKDNDPDSILRFTMPRLMGPLLKSGDLKGANAASEWLRSDTTRTATKTWGEGMIAAQAGDSKTALEKFVSAGRTKGYGGDYEIGEPEPTEGGGFRVNLTTKDGRTLSKEFKNPDEVLKFGALYLNPESAFKQWQEQQEAEAKSKREVGNYAAKKDVDIANAPRENATFLERFKGQKAAELEHEKAKDAAGLGARNYQPFNVTTVDENGKPVVRPYSYDTRSGTSLPMKDKDGNDVSGAIAKPGTGGGGASGRRPFQFEVVRDAYKALGYSDQDATDIAAGRKPPKDVELVNISRQLTTMEMPPSDMRYKPEQRRARQEEILKGLREQYSGGGSHAPLTPRPVTTQPVQPAAQRPEQMTPGNGNKPVDIKVPPRPSAVPPGSAYSPSRGMWRSPDGKVFDAQGNPVS